MPLTAARACHQLGVGYPYAGDGNGGPPLAELVRWGGASAGGRLGEIAPLFPRLDVETAPSS